MNYRLTAEKGDEVVQDYGVWESLTGCYLKVLEVDGPDAMENPLWPEGCDAVATELRTGDTYLLEADAWTQFK